MLDLARSGAVKVEAEQFDLADGPKAFERLHMHGRSVGVPCSSRSGGGARDAGAP